MPIAYMAPPSNGFALMAFTAVTIVAYFVMNDQAWSSPPGLVDKAIEVALIVVLYLDSRR